MYKYLIKVISNVAKNFEYNYWYIDNITFINASKYLRKCTQIKKN